MGWPFVSVIVLASIGLFVSKIIFTESGQIFLTVAAVIVGSYLFVAAAIRIYRSDIHPNMKFPFNSNILTSSILFILIYIFSYVAILHGVTTLLGFFITQPQQQIIQVQSKSRTAGGRGSTVGSLHTEQFIFPSKALHASPVFLSQIKPGDSVLLKGRGAWFGLYVDRITLLSP